MSSKNPLHFDGVVTIWHYERVKRLWKDASLPFKCFLVLSLFTQTGSIASLSQTFFQWKGFFWLPIMMAVGIVGVSGAFNAAL